MRGRVEGRGSGVALHDAALRYITLADEELRALERERPGLVVRDGEALLVAQQRSDRVDLQYAFPDAGAFARQFPSLFARVAGLFSPQQAPFGISFRLTDLSQRPHVEPVLLAEGFSLTREWLRMTLDELPAAARAADEIAPGFRLRPATADDAEAIVQLIFVAFVAPSATPAGWREILESGYQVRILEDAAGSSAGLLNLRPEDAATGYVAELAVHPDFQRRGLGEAMMRWGLAWFSSKGLTSAALQVNTDNAPAIAVYRKLGFVVSESGCDYRCPIGEDALRARGGA